MVIMAIIQILLIKVILCDLSGLLPVKAEARTIL